MEHQTYLREFVELAESIILIGGLAWARATASKAAKNAMSAAEQSKANSIKLETLHRRLTPAQVFIADDDPNDIELMTMALRRLDADVTSATDAKGIERIIRNRTKAERGYPFDLAIVDLRMNGAEAILLNFKMEAPAVERCVITGGIVPNPQVQAALRICEPYTFLTKPLEVDTAEEMFIRLNVPYKRKPKFTPL